MRTANDLRSEMAAKGLSVQELARRTGASYQRVWNQLNGRTALTEQDAEAIVRALDQGAPTTARAARAERRTVAPTRRTGERRQTERRSTQGRRFAIIVSRWNEFVTNELLNGAIDELRSHGDPAVHVVRVPGTWEMPVAARALLNGAEAPVAIVALGCILQGETPHADRLASDVGSALMGLQVQYGVPIAWGVLTPDTQEQALDRCGLKMGNKGREAALAAIEMARIIEAVA